MALNETISDLPALFRYLQPVMTNLAAPETQLAEFFRGLNRTAGAVAPVSQANVEQFAAAATTFAAFSHNPDALRQTIYKSPPTLDVSTDSLRAQMPFLRDTAALSGDLNAASDELRASLPDINAALVAGVGTLRRSTALNDKLIVAFRALRGLSRDPNTFIALNALGATVDTLNPQLRFLGPFVTVCNSWNFFWYTLGEHISEEDAYGYAQRALLNSTGQQTNSEGSIGATEPANGEGYVAASASRGTIQYWHGQPYPAAIDNRGQADCENGQRGYPTHLSQYAGKDSQGKPFLIANDPHTPGDQGPTYKRLTPNGGVGLGRRRVLPGQTYTREPQTGYKLNNYPGNN
jgi:hypothetical protein